MKKYVLIVLALALSDALYSQGFFKKRKRKKQQTEQTSNINTQKNISKNPTMSNNSQELTLIKKLYLEADSLKNNQLPKSALEKFNEVRVLSEKEQQYGYFIAAKFREIFINQELFENPSDERILKDIDTLIKQVPQNALALVLMSRVDFYKKISRENRFKNTNDESENISDWSPKKLRSLILTDIDQAIALAASNDINFDLTPLVSEIEKPTFELTVNQLILLKALETLSDLDLSTNSDYVSPKVNEVYSPANEFINFNFKTENDPYLDYKKLELYQLLLKTVFPVNEAEKGKFIWFDLKRILFVEKFSSDKNLKTKALENIYYQNISSDFSNLVAYELGLIYKSEPNSNLKTHQFLTKAIQNFPQSEYNESLNRLINEIELKIINLNIESNLEPLKPILAKFSLKNVNSVEINILKVDDVIKFKSLTQNSYGDGLKNVILANYKPISSLTQNFPKTSDFEQHSYEIMIPDLPEGIYLFHIKDKDSEEEIISSFITVSEKIIVKTESNREKLHLISAKNGMPISSINYNIYEYTYQKEERYKKINSGKTDKDGFVNSLPKNKSILVVFNNNELFYETYISDYNYDNYDEEKQFRCVLFTDRKLYRPGQKVYFKAIVHNDANKTVPNIEITLTLFDKNQQIIESKKLKTNNFGSINGVFILPSGGSVSGAFHLSISQKKVHASHYFNVEEYKRPKYKAEILKPEKTFKLNDQIELTGKAMAYSGFAVQDAKVKYTVKRTQKPKWEYYYWRMPMESSSVVTITTEETKTNEKGEFLINFKALPDDKISEESNPYFNYEVEAVITDLNGEVKICKYTLTLAYTDIEVSVTGETEVYSNTSTKLVVSVKNMQGVHQPINGVILLEKLLISNAPKKARLWDKADSILISQKDFETNFPDFEFSNKESFELVQSKDLLKWINVDYTLKMPKEAGKYKITLVTKDSRGKTIKSSHWIDVLPNEKEAFNFPEFLKVNFENKNYQPGEKVKIKISSAVNCFVKMLAKSNRGTLVEKIINLNQNTFVETFEIIEKDRGNITVELLSTNNYRNYTENLTINVPYSNKELNYNIVTLRDNTLPGSPEKWVLKISGNNKEKIISETVATLYDQSLDELYDSNDWNYFPYGNYYSNEFFNKYNFSKSYLLYDKENYISHYGASIHYKQLINFYYENYRWDNGIVASDFSSVQIKSMNNRNFKTGGRKNKESELPMKFEAMESDADGVDDMNESETDNKPKESSNSNQNIRTNFNETAFFFPNIYNNDKGEIVLEFSMPETLTQWKLLLFGHTKDMKIGKFQHSITTSKPVMIQPDVPRFLREKDKIFLAAKVVNTTNQAIEGKVSLQIENLDNLAVLNWIKNQKEQNITVPANASKACYFEVDVPLFTGIINLTYVVKSSTHSDGEKHTIPVLTNRKLIIETLPITVKKAGTQTLEFSSMKNNNSSSLKNHLFTVEMTANPAWYAVQSLPYMTDFVHDCAEQTFSKLYANLITQFIYNNNPSIKAILTKWKEQNKSNPQDFASQLEKNKELKYLILEETPWLLEAQNQTKNIQQLLTLFDDDRLKSSITDLSAKLKEMQMDNGAWGWFKGMYPNRYISQTIVLGFAKLKQIGVDISSYNSMIQNAIQFIDGETTKEYYIRKQNKWYINSIDVQYLYLKSQFQTYGIDKTHVVITEQISQIDEQWTGLSLISKSQLITALHLFKEKETVKNTILKSLNETAIKSELRGMYWKENTRGYYWFNAPIETQAALIEAYVITNQSIDDVYNMQIWLLRQKQTQNWKTTTATADACFALMMRGTKNLLQSKQVIEIVSDELKIKASAAENGLGYIKESLSSEKISSKNANISVKASEDGFAYGAVYWQYFEDLDKIEAHGSGLSIQKNIYVVRMTKEGKKKELLKEGETLQIGDIIEVTLSIVADRNMEYIHIKDLRGSGTEPTDIISSYKWQNGLGYYQTTLDGSTNFFIDYLNKGSYQVTYQLKVQQAGTYSSGLATIQCMYAPEFTGNSKAQILTVKQ